MNARAGWFDVDRAGLAMVAARRTKVFILRELIQNAWDVMYRGWSLYIERIAITVSWPEIVFEEDIGCFAFLMTTIVIIHTRPKWSWRYAAAIQILGFGFGISVDHVENPFRKRTPL